MFSRFGGPSRASSDASGDLRQQLRLLRQEPLVAAHLRGVPLLQVPSRIGRSRASKRS